jgi:hypothetical protein
MTLNLDLLACTRVPGGFYLRRGPVRLLSIVECVDRPDKTTIRFISGHTVKDKVIIPLATFQIVWRPDFFIKQRGTATNAALFIIDFYVLILEGVFPLP